ncbi:MAG TPA: hypothetical protein VH518_13040 [Tepidisphaeraceae bacterium]|jgi:hypothetical protein
MIAVSFPRTDNDLLSFSANFKNLITASPASYGLTAGDAASYGTVHTAYTTALVACEPAQRNKTGVVAKNAARAVLKANAILLANKIYSTATVTDAQKVELGIPPRSAPTPIPPPSGKPGIAVVSVSAWTVKIRLRDTESGAKRGKPPGVFGASIFSFVGAAAPTDIGAWRFEGSTGRTVLDLTFPSTLEPGTKVWLAAFWFNGRKQSGPASDPISTYVLGGGVAMAA